MPQDAVALVRESQAASAYDQVLFLGEPKVGKSTTIVSSAVKAFGPGYVINCGSKTGLMPASRRTTKFKFDVIRNEAQLDEAIKEARRGSKEGDYKWGAVDDFNLYASWLEQDLEDESRNPKGEANSFRFWRKHRQKLANALIRLFDCRAHFYCIAHRMDLSPEIKGQMAKSGRGVFPLIGGQARKEIPSMFADVVFMDYGKNDERVFCLNPAGVFGSACRSLDDTREIPADVGVLHDAFAELGAKKALKPRR